MNSDDFDPDKVSAALRELEALDREIGRALATPFEREIDAACRFNPVSVLKPSCTICGSVDVFPGLPRCRICESVWQSDQRAYRGYGK